MFVPFLTEEYIKSIPQRQEGYIGGHNLLKHNLEYLSPAFDKTGGRLPKVIGYRTEMVIRLAHITAEADSPT